MAKVNALRELQSQTGEKLGALLPSALDKAFKTANRLENLSALF